MADIFDNYLMDDSKGPLVVDQGSELLDENSMCSNLPLNATDCYLTSNPDASFFEHLVANYIPLGEHIAVSYTHLTLPTKRIV